MLKNYLKTALRNLFRSRGYAVINIAGLALGMAVCLLIYLWVQDEWSFDRYNEHFDRIFRLAQVQHFSDQVIHSSKTPPPLGQALVNDYPEIEQFTRYGTFIGEVLIRRDENAFYELGGAYVDPGFFQIFTVPFLQGDPDAPFSGRFSTVITRSMAQKYFGDENPVGLVLKLENVCELEVTGVIEDPPGNAHLQYDFLVPYILYEAWGADLTQWGGWNDYTYVLLSPTASAEAVSQKIGPYLQSVSARTQDTIYLQPLADIHLFSNLAYDAPAVLGDINTVYIFSAIALFILLLGCFNFINITTARATRRAKEVGLRKTIGADRMQLVRQFVGETVLLTLISFALCLVLVELLLPLFNELVGKSLRVDLYDSGQLAGFTAVLLLTGLFAGGYPALVLSSFNPVEVLKGTQSFNLKSTRFRRILVVFQFTISISLISSTLILYKQLNYVQHKKLGFDKENVIRIQNRPGMYRQYPLFKERLLTHRNIIGVTAAGSTEIPYPVQKDVISWEGKRVDEDINLYAISVDFDYFATLGMELVEGRDFSTAFGTDSSSAFIVNQSAARIIAHGSVIGKRLELDGKEGQIVGVVRDYHATSLYQPIKPLILTVNNGVPVYQYVRVAPGDVAHTIRFIEEQWYEIVPDFPFEFSFLDAKLNQFYLNEHKLGLLLMSFSLLAIFIACLGLFGMASFTAERRTKEIGVRKVLGASTVQVVKLMTAEFAVTVLIAGLIAWPLAWIGMQYWLRSFAYRTTLDTWIFALATGLALVIAIATVSYQAIKTAFTDPVKSLRYE